MAIQSENRPMTPIVGLKVRGACDVNVRRGAPSMVVLAERPEDVLTELHGGVLSVSQRSKVVSGGSVMMNLQGDGNIQIVSVNGNVTISHGRGQRVVQDQANMGRVLVEVTVPELPASAAVAGSGEVVLHDVRQDTLKLEVSGSGTIHAAGEVVRLSADVAGSGAVRAKNLRTEHADLDVAGSGEVHALVVHSLKTRVAGSGEVKVWGNPAKRDVRVAGSGEVLFDSGHCS